MKPGDLVFIKGTEGLAGPIKKFTKSPYTHIAGVVFTDQLVEAQALRRTGYEPLETYKGVSDVYTCPLLSEADRKRIADFTIECLGTKYDYFLFGLLTFRHLLRPANFLYANGKRYICTTLWADAYRSVGLDLCPGIQHPTPGELAASSLLERVGEF